MEATVEHGELSLELCGDLEGWGHTHIVMTEPPCFKQKPAQHCKAIILQLKKLCKNLKNKVLLNLWRKRKRENRWPPKRLKGGRNNLHSESEMRDFVFNVRDIECLPITLALRG